MNDDLVRDALADLAPLAPADDAAYAGVRRAVSRRRRRRATGRIAAAAVLVVGLIAGGLTLGSLRQEDEGGLVTRPPADPQTDGGTRTPTGSGRRQSFAAMSFELPEGWVVISHDTAEDTMCLGPPDGADGLPDDMALAQYADCSGLMLYHGDPLPGFEMEEYEDHGPWGWYHQTDVSFCQNGDPVEPGPAGYDPVASRDLDIGGQVAAYDLWEARCGDSGLTFSPRAWHFDEPEILMVDVFGWTQVDEILASVRWRN